jgi:4-amino-4-deoxy-L-arabinose transferase-like glycosyltransferase
VSVNAQASISTPRLRVGAPGLALPLIALVVLLLSIPLLAAEPANLTSDESLYLAEAYNIANGEGGTYPSGDAIVHRAPLFPLVLAPFVRLGGPDAAYAITKAIVVVNALLVMLLAYRMGGALAGSIAGVAAAGAAYLNGLGTTLYLDPLECTFMLLALLALEQATRARPVGWFAVAGGLIGASFLVKEAAVQWAPLGLLVCLAVPALRTRTGGAGAVVFTASFAAVIAPWWIWVWAHDSSVYLLGAEGMRLPIVAGSAAACVVVALAAVFSRLPRRDTRLRKAAPFAAVLLVCTWTAVLLYGLEQQSGWKADAAYVHTVPRYLLDVAPLAQPYFALALAWVWLAWRAARADDAARLILAAASLFIAFVLHAANREAQLRDALPLVYLSYVALGLATAWGVQKLSVLLAHRAAEPLLITMLAVLGAIFVVQQGAAFRDENVAATEVDGASSWDSEFVVKNAAWMSEHLPEGSRVLSSRLFFSSLHVNSEARFHIYQMPTVRVDIDPSTESFFVPRSNLFRWGEHEVRPYETGDEWLYVRQYPGKDYWIALSQGELMDYIEHRDIEYVTVSGDDMTFSPLAYALYFSAHPAFDLIYHDARSATEQFFVYRVEPSRLGIVDLPIMTSASSRDSLQRETGMTLTALERRLGQPLQLTDLEAGFSPREEQDAVSIADRR